MRKSFTVRLGDKELDKELSALIDIFVELAKEKGITTKRALYEALLNYVEQNTKKEVKNA